MKIIFSIVLISISLSSFSCTEGETFEPSSGITYTCDKSLPLESAWRDPRGLVWGEGENCEAMGARLPEKDELRFFQDETNFFSARWCVKYIVHHYFRFPKTPAIPFEGDILDFYSTKKPYGEFSNFSGFPIFVDGEWWSTSEHYFQAMKYESEELRDWVQFAPTPMEAANRGRNPNFPKRADWEEVKEGFMEKALMDKYHRHPELRELLLSTGTSQIFEHTTNDCHWGDCGDRSGKNRLGILLMAVRETLR